MHRGVGRLAFEPVLTYLMQQLSSRATPTLHDMRTWKVRISTAATRADRREKDRPSRVHRITIAGGAAQSAPRNRAARRRARHARLPAERRR